MKIQPYLRKIIEEKLAPESGVVLDIGYGSGKESKKLFTLGYKIEGVEKKDLVPKNVDGIFHENTDIRDFTIEPDKYSIILAASVFPFIGSKQDIKKKVKEAYEGLVPGGIFYFSLLGPNDGWKEHSRITFLTYEEASSILPTKPHFSSTEEGFGPMMNENIKWWHIHRFFYKKPIVQD